VSAVRFAAELSEDADPERALRSAIDALRAALAGDTADWIACFASAEHAPRAEELARRLRAAFPRAALLGCTARSVIGGGRELEAGPGLALFGACLPGIAVRPFHLAPEAVEALARDPRGVAAEIGLASDAASVVLLADPWSTDVESLLVGLDALLPAATKIGGLASGGSGPRSEVLFAGDALLRSGVAGLALSGPLRVDTIVAQGCRPVGQPMFATRCSGRVLEEVDGRRPLDVLNELYAGADPRDRALLRHSLLIGLEMQPERERYGRGDFLMRNLTGIDPETGALEVAALLRERQIVQLHVRDARSADADLAEHLARYGGAADVGAALLFSCLGRGRPLYGMPDHDSDAFRDRVAKVPIAGFFGNGEIGPVEGRSFLHAYTSAFAVFRPA
jgi:small ligand-binding sensory domain FIST